MSNNENASKTGAVWKKEIGSYKICTNSDNEFQVTTPLGVKAILTDFIPVKKDPYQLVGDYLICTSRWSGAPEVGDFLKFKIVTFYGSVTDWITFAPAKKSPFRQKQKDNYLICTDNQDCYMVIDPTGIMSGWCFCTKT